MSCPQKLLSWQMFDRIAPTYDTINRLLSFRQDQKWRRSLCPYLPDKKNLNILDLATGTADQMIAFLEAKDSIQSITGLDLSSEMLKIGKEKIGKKPYKNKVRWIEASAEKIPAPDHCFDVVSMSFGIRNVPHVEKALSEIFRVLKSEGKCLILEFSLPPQPIRSAYLFYLRHILPRIGGLFSRSFSSYRYLNTTIETFPSGESFARLLKQAGFNKIEIHPMALGAVTLYIGIKS